MKELIQSRITGIWGEFCQVDFVQGYEHRRKDCPDHQGWVLQSGRWRLETQKRQHGGFLHFAPFERCHRIAETKGTGLSLQVFRTQETERLHPNLLGIWRMMQLSNHHQLDSLALDCLLMELPRSRKSDPPGWLKKVFDLIHEQPEIDWNIKQFSEFASISPCHLMHEFKDHFGERLFERRTAELG